MRHAGNFCQCPEGGQRGPCPEQSVSGGAAGEAGEEEQDFHAADAGPGRGARRWLSELALGWVGAVVLAVPAVASLVVEVGLEGGGQRQRVDLTQALLPQGQAHRAAAEIHERQGFRCGDRGETEDTGLAQL